jgi:hypothetical protein
VSRAEPSLDIDHKNVREVAASVHLFVGWLPDPLLVLSCVKSVNHLRRNRNVRLLRMSRTERSQTGQRFPVAAGVAFVRFVVAGEANRNQDESFSDVNHEGAAAVGFHQVSARDNQWVIVH